MCICVHHFHECFNFEVERPQKCIIVIIKTRFLNAHDDLSQVNTCIVA